MSNRQPKSTGSVSDNDRRTFLKAALGGGLALATLPSLSGCLVDERTGSTGERPVRRSVASLMQSDPNGILDSYKDAVEQMKNLPSSDPRSWNNQASIHGLELNGRGTFNECEHSNWLFLPWHRAYLFFFEDICRDLSGNPDFALPYWNWIENPQVPSAFEGGSSNPLYDSTRIATSTGAPANQNLVGPTVMENTLNEPNFLRFGGGWQGVGATPPIQVGSGSLESPPHNYIHGYVGGNMSRAWSPRDPLFWLHHCMVDCLWWEWNGVRGHPNPNDREWLLATFDGDFVDVAGDAVESVSVLRTLLMPYISYAYEPTTKGEREAIDPGVRERIEVISRLLDELEDEEISRILDEVEDEDGNRVLDEVEDEEIDRILDEVEEVREIADVELELIERAELGEQIDVRVGEPVEIETDVRLDDIRPYLEGEEEGRISIAALEVDPPERGQFVTNVFVSQRDARIDLQPDSPNYAGAISFFVDENPDLRQSFFVDVTDALFTLYRREELTEDDTLSVHFDAVPFEGRESEEEEFTIGRLTLDVTRSIIDGEIVERPPKETDRDE